jgi:hypothetical protein
MSHSSAPCYYQSFPFLRSLILKSNPLRLQIEKLPKRGWCITYPHNEWHKIWRCVLIISNSDKGSHLSLNDYNGVYKTPFFNAFGCLCSFCYSQKQSFSIMHFSFCLKPIAMLLNISLNIFTWVDVAKYLKFVKKYSNFITRLHNIQICQNIFWSCCEGIFLLL